ncbi:hypothetical protein J6590_026547 [Homalodisca vitripennis]|nr:hypothetical protein J6590_026547 [Homalodisca vitripennis]
MEPPNGSLDTFHHSLTEILDKMDACQCNVIIAGDFNIDSLKDSREQKEVTELLASYNITRMTLPPTRITANSVTSIDAICTNMETNKVTLQKTGKMS